MISFDQETDSYRPKNRVKPVHQVDIVKTLEVKLNKNISSNYKKNEKIEV